MKGFTGVLLVVFIGFVLVLGLMFFFNYFGVAWTSVGSAVVDVVNQQAGNNSNPANATQSLYNGMNNFLASGDFMIAGLFFGSVLAILMSAFLVRFSPLFLPVYVLFTIIATYISIFLRDAYLSISKDFVWFSSFPYSTQILTWLPYITAVVGGMIILVQYAFRTEY